MKIITEYISTKEKNEFQCFLCELDKDTLLRINIKNANECQIQMEDKASGITEVHSIINKDDLEALVKVFRDVYYAMNSIDKTEDNKPSVSMPCLNIHKC